MSFETESIVHKAVVHIARKQELIKMQTEMKCYGVFLSLASYILHKHRFHLGLSRTYFKNKGTKST